MPLRDHFRAPLIKSTTWEGFHGQWPAIIVQKLGKELPNRYVAEPRVHAGAPNAEYEVRIFDAERDRRLVAAVEIVSPANKDRPEHRQVFVAKCAALLRQNVSVVIVDPEPLLTRETCASVVTQEQVQRLIHLDQKGTVEAGKSRETEGGGAACPTRGFSGWWWSVKAR